MMHEDDNNDTPFILKIKHDPKASSFGNCLKARSFVHYFNNTTANHIQDMCLQTKFKTLVVSRKSLSTKSHMKFPYTQHLNRFVAPVVEIYSLLITEKFIIKSVVFKFVLQ